MLCTARAARVVLLVAVLTVPALAGALPAGADAGEESAKAGDLVRQAIALIVNTPKDRMAITDKVNDALGAKQTKGVNLDLVREAKTALDVGDLHRGRALLEASIGARPHVTGAEVLPIGETSHPPAQTAPATGSQTGINVTTAALEARRRFDSGTWLALGAMVLLVVAGVALAIRYRPPLSVRSLRAATSVEETS